MQLISIRFFLLVSSYSDLLVALLVPSPVFAYLDCKLARSVFNDFLAIMLHTLLLTRENAVSASPSNKCGLVVYLNMKEYK